MLSIQRFSIAFIGFCLFSCDNGERSQSLLSMPVTSTLEVTGEALQDYQQLLQNHSHQQTLSPASLQVFSERYAKAETSIYAINRKQKGETSQYSVTVIFDQIPEDDSTSGYRYDMQLQLKDAALEITKMEQSWRCWPGRGQQEFSTEACR